MNEQELKEIEGRSNMLVSAVYKDANGIGMTTSLSNCQMDFRLLLAEVRRLYFKCIWCERNCEHCFYSRGTEYGGIDDEGNEICIGCRQAAVYKDETSD